MGPLLATNLALRFALELAALGVWGAEAFDAPLASVLAAIGAPLCAGTVWGLIVSPKARIDHGPALRVGAELLVLGGAALALAAAGHERAAVVQGALVTVHLVLFHATDPTATSRPRSA